MKTSFSFDTVTYTNVHRLLSRMSLVDENRQETAFSSLETLQHWLTELQFMSADAGKVRHWYSQHDASLLIDAYGAVLLRDALRCMAFCGDAMNDMPASRFQLECRFVRRFNVQIAYWS
jgi:hypothetical protein